MQMSYPYVSNLPFKNFCKLAKRAETIRNYQKQVLVMIKHWIKTTDSRSTSFIQPRNRYSWTLCTLQAVKETPGYASILGSSISLASLFTIQSHHCLSFIPPFSDFSGSRRYILVSRRRTPFDQHQESRPLRRSTTASPLFTDWQILLAENTKWLHCVCCENWAFPEVAILFADQN